MAAPSGAVIQDAMYTYQGAIVSALSNLQHVSPAQQAAISSLPQPTAQVLQAVVDPAFAPSIASLMQTLSSPTTLEHLTQRATSLAPYLSVSRFVSGGQANLNLMPFLLPDDTLYGAASLTGLGASLALANPCTPAVESVCRTVDIEQGTVQELVAALTELLLMLAEPHVPAGGCLNSSSGSAADDGNGYAGRAVVGQAFVECSRLLANLYSEVVVGNAGPTGGVSGPANVDSCQYCSYDQTSVSDGEVYPGNSYTVRADDYHNPAAGGLQSDPPAYTQFYLA